MRQRGTRNASRFPMGACILRRPGAPAQWARARFCRLLVPAEATGTRRAGPERVAAAHSTAADAAAACTTRFAVRLLCCPGRELGSVCRSESCMARPYTTSVMQRMFMHDPARPGPPGSAARAACAHPYMQLKGRAAGAGRAPRDEVPLQVDGRRAQDEPGPGGLVAQHQVRGQQAAHGLARCKRGRRARPAGELGAHVARELRVVVHLRARACGASGLGTPVRMAEQARTLVARAPCRRSQGSALRCSVLCGRGAACGAGRARAGVEAAGAPFTSPPALPGNPQRLQSGKQGLGRGTGGPQPDRRRPLLLMQPALDSFSTQPCEGARGP